MSATSTATTTTLHTDEHGDVTAILDRPLRATGPALLLSHGAGGGIESAGLTALATGLAAAGTMTARANLPYREAGRRSPPRADRAAPAYAAILAVARAEFAPKRPWAAGGKSYGGRVASMAAATGMPVDALVFYGYPLHPPGKQENLRVDHWPHIEVPCLFLQGSHDSFCDLDLLDANLRKLPRRATLQVVEGGDHSLKVAGKNAPDGKPRSEARVLADLAPIVRAWLNDLDLG